MKKRFVSVLLVLVLVSVGLGAQSTKKLKFGFAIQNLGNPFFVQLTQEMKKLADQKGVALTISPAGDDVSKQVSIIENFIALKMDAILIMAVDPKGVSDVAKRALAAGIKVLTAGSALDDYTALLNVDQHDVGLKIGKLAGEWVNKKLGGKAEVALLTDSESSEIIIRSKAIEEGLKSVAPNAKIVANAQGRSTESGMKNAENILQAHPNIKVFACYGDGVGLGAMEAVKSAGKATDDFAVFGADANPQALAAIKAGTIFRGTIDYNTQAIPEVALNALIQAGSGKPVPKLIMQPLNVVTPQNIDQFIR